MAVILLLWKERLFNVNCLSTFNFSAMGSDVFFIDYIIAVVYVMIISLLVIQYVAIYLSKTLAIHTYIRTFIGDVGG